MTSDLNTTKEISCRVTRTLLLYVREQNDGSLGNLLDGLSLDENYLTDTHNWVSHAFLQTLYERMIDLLKDDNAVYRMTLASGRLQSLGILDRIVRLLGSPRLIYTQAPRYNPFLKLNGSVVVHDIGESWVVLEDRYHDSDQKTRFDCDYTRGILAGIPTLFDLPPAQVEEIKCQVSSDTYGKRRWPDNPPQGRGACLYRVTWQPHKRSFIKRFFDRRNTRRQAIEELVQANQLIQSKYDEARQLAADLEVQQRKLKESERKYRLLAENVSDTIWILKLKSLEFDYISPSVEHNRGFTVAEAKALSLEQTLSPQSLETVTRILEMELARDGQPGVDPLRSRRVEIEESLKSGGYAWAEATVSFIRDTNGEPSAIMGVTRDISERKAAEEQLSESERKYRNLFENGSDIICIHDLEGNLLDTNLTYKTEYGWRQEDLDGVNIRQMITERYRSEFDAYLDRVIANGSDAGYLNAFTSSGREVVLEYRNRLIRDGEGQPVAVQGAARDVTDRIKYEKALKESEEKYKALVRHAPAGIFEVDLETMSFISVNEVICAYTGYKEAALMQMDPLALFDDASRDKAIQRLEEVFATHQDPVPAEYRIVAKNGQTFRVVMNSKFFFEDGVAKRLMTVVHDLTNIRKAEEEKRELEKKLAHARKLESLGALAGGVAHDLNNILSGIVSYPDLLLMDIDADSTLRQPLLTIKRSGQKAAEIVQDLLTLARRNVATKKVIALNQLVTTFIASPEYRQIVGDRPHVHLETDLAAEMLNVMGSEAHLSKSLMNLVANAADAMPSGGSIAVSTRDCYIDSPYTGFEIIPEGEYAVLEVADRGIGMPPTDLEKIFEPFYTKKVMGRSGTGLGMSVVWGTVKDHDGFIDVDTEEGSGTTFALYFPATRAQQAVEETIHIEDYLGRGESILIVDDAAEQRDLAGRMMRRLGYQVTLAPSGEAALAWIDKQRFDLLILDMIMPPGMDGLQTYKAILKKVPAQKAVIASGFAQTENVHAAQRLGAGSYIKKPYTLERIGTAVRTELDK